MISALLIFTLVVWTFFGFVILFNARDADLKPSFRLALVLGPAITAAFGVIIVGYLISERVIEWLKKA